MTWTFCASQAAINKAGANANATIVASGAALAEYCNQAEGAINSTITDVSLIDDYATLNAETKGILTQACSSWIGIKIVNYDADSIGRNTATLRLNVLRDEYMLAMAELKNKNTQDFIKNS